MDGIWFSVARKMKLVCLLLLTLMVAAYVVDAIPNNCVPCTTNTRILCRKPTDGFCKILRSTNGGTSTMKDYTLVGTFSCDSLDEAAATYCVAGKLIDPEWNVAP